MKILIAEDDARLLKSLLHIFTLNRFSADGVTDGKEALEYALTGEYDGLVFDIMMPGMDGVDTLHQMQKMECFIQEPSVVIALTANAVIGAKEGYLEEGFTDYLSKPIDYVKLEDMIRKYLPEGMCEMNS